MKELLEPLVPIATFFIVFALGLGARVAAASVLPLSEILIDRILMPSFADVSSIASPSPSSSTEDTISSDKLVAEKGPESFSNSVEAKNALQHNAEVQLNRHTGAVEAISSSQITGKKDNEAILSSPTTGKKDDDCSKMHVHQRGRSSSGQYYWRVTLGIFSSGFRV